MSASKTLAKMVPTAAVKTGPIEKLITSTQFEQPFKPAAGIDDHAVHMGIVRHLGMDFSLGSAELLLGEARRLTVDERRARIERAWC